MFFAVMNGKGQGQLVFAGIDTSLLADLCEVIDIFSELTGYVLGVYPGTNVLH